MSSTDSILNGKYPAKNHAKRVAKYLEAAGYSQNGVIYLESQKTQLIEDNDEPMPFRYVGHIFRPCPTLQLISRHSVLAYLSFDLMSSSLLSADLPAGNAVPFTIYLAASCPIHI